MKKFIETNTVTYNLMSFSGFKGLIIFSLLLDGPKSYDDIKACFLQHQYLHEAVSADTIRIYINTLKKIGCSISKFSKNRVTYYKIDSHPFKLQITDKQTKSILKIFKALCANIDLEDFMALQSFFEKISPYITNEDLKNRIKNISPLKNINPDIIKELMKHVKNKNFINLLYNSPNTTKKNIDILADKMFISNNKLYLSGITPEYKNYGNLIVNRIMNINYVCLDKKIEMPEFTVQYELFTENENFVPETNEKIIEKLENKIIVEINSNNKFFVIQRILSHANKCKVIAPEDFKLEIISYLKKMKEGYFEQ